VGTAAAPFETGGPPPLGRSPSGFEVRPRCPSRSAGPRRRTASGGRWPSSSSCLRGRAQRGDVGTRPRRAGRRWAPAGPPVAGTTVAGSRSWARGIDRWCRGTPRPSSPGRRHVPGTPLPGTLGDSVLVGHRVAYGGPSATSPRCWWRRGGRHRGRGPGPLRRVSVAPGGRTVALPPPTPGPDRLRATAGWARRAAGGAGQLVATSAYDRRPAGPGRVRCRGGVDGRRPWPPRLARRRGGGRPAGPLRPGGARRRCGPVGLRVAALIAPSSVQKSWAGTPPITF